MHEGFHSQKELEAPCKTNCLSELTRRDRFWSRGFAVVLVLKFLLASARFVEILTRKGARLDSPAEAGLSVFS